MIFGTAKLESLYCIGSLPDITQTQQYPTQYQVPTQQYQSQVQNMSPSLNNQTCKRQTTSLERSSSNSVNNNAKKQLFF